MSTVKRRAPVDPDRKARFREEARSIVFKDRDDRRYGRAVDTAGAIARALERAWRDGFAAGQDDDPQPAIDTAADEGPIPWHRIPPRPRSAFWTICLWFIGKTEQHVDRGSLLVAGTTPRGTGGWTLIRDSSRNDHDTFGDRTIRPLIRLGLLEATTGADTRLVLSVRGRETWAAFLTRGGQYPDDRCDL